ncbi:MAG TPA: XdhC family protein [Anaerolineales bacterium]|nr:XdhC family protein [Anaerolineales bacterium]
MRDILPDLDRWHAEDGQLALATVLQTWGSSPRRAGAKMAVASDGQFTGSVSGGCVENAVIEAALDSMKTDRARLLHFGVADETAWEVGLACGGSIDIFVKPLDADFFPFLRAAWTQETDSVHVTVIRGSEHILGREMLAREDGSVTGSIGNHRDKKAVELASEVFMHGTSQRVMLDEETELFLEYIAPPPTLIVVGGVHITVALVSIAKTLGFRTVLVDPRSVWGSEERFPNVDQLIQSWPQEAFTQVPVTHSTAIVMLTHDPKLDDPALKVALDSPAFYIGALGSKTTHAKRRERLLAEGVNEAQLSRLHAPIGLDIGAETPEEIALAIMSEVVEAYRKRNQEAAEQEVRSPQSQ